MLFKNILGNRPEISALLLTVGEKTFAEAYRALEAQTAPLSQIIVVRNVSPFSAAFNEGVSQITTPFFLQCDADMILDLNCVEVLFSKMTPRTGVVAGHLRDPLQGRIGAVKLYRTECCRLYPQEDSFNCEYNFFTQLSKDGRWAVKVVEDNGITLGAHHPSINDPLYNFERFKYLGVKIYGRAGWYDFAHRLIHLGRSDNQTATPMAVLAMVCGFYILQTTDHLKVYEPSSEYRLWQKRFGRPRKTHKVPGSYPPWGAYNFLVGYWEGVLFRSGLRRFNIERIIKESLTSSQYSHWAYLLGLCSSVMNPYESWHQNMITKFLRMRPFLDYLDRKLAYHYAAP